MSRFTPGGREPAIDMPRVVVVSILLLLAIQALRVWFLSETTDLDLVLGGGFVPARLSVALGWTDVETVVREAAASSSDPDVSAAHAAIARFLVTGSGAKPWTLLTHAFLHGSWVHVGLNCVWLAAFGTPVARRMGTERTLMLAAFSAVAGALFYWLLNREGAEVLIGASGAVSGLMGAAALFVFARDRWPPPPASFAGLLGNRNALLFLLVWFVVNIATGLVAAPLGIVEGGIAWEAHIGGLLAGLLAFPFLDPVGR